jgi:hypothetical protein
MGLISQKKMGHALRFVIAHTDGTDRYGNGAKLLFLLKYMSADSHETGSERF